MLGVAGFSIVTAVIFLNSNIDHNWFMEIRTNSIYTIEIIAAGISFIGGWLIWIVIGAYVICAFYFRLHLNSRFELFRHPLTAVTLIAIALALTALTTEALKLIVARPRPDGGISGVVCFLAAGSGFSYPSGHAARAVTAVVILSFFLTPIYSTVCWLFAAVVCWSRVYIGVHYPLDVLAGVFLGLMTGAGTMDLCPKLKHAFRKFEMQGKNWHTKTARTRN